MRIPQLFYLLNLIACSLGAPGLQPRTSHVLHEKRSTSSRWKRTDRVHPEAVIPLRIGLTQTNLEKGHDLLMDISHPSSPNYGKYWSAEKIHELFKPTNELVQAIKDWLIQEKVNASEIEHSQNKGWLTVDLPAREVERLFLAEYHILENSGGDLVSIGCDEYSVPAHLAEHIDYIRPGVKIAAPLKKRRPESRRKRSIIRVASEQLSDRLEKRSSGLGQIEASGDVSIEKLCSNHTDVPLACIKALYQIPEGHLATPGYELGIFEQGSYFDEHDLDLFYATYAPYVPNGTYPKVESIDGGEAPINCRNGDPNFRCGEADIDMQLAIPIVYPQKVVNYQVDDAYYAPKEVALDNTFNTFLDALDGSYCNYTAYGITGDSPDIDPQYPDKHKKGYKGQRQCGTVTPTKVISISYGESEEDFPANYVRRQCNEFMKLGLQGHSIFIASGDYGVGVPVGDPPGSNGCLSNAKEGLNGTIFNPAYPADCPYITSVGGTMLPPGNRTSLEEWTMHVPAVTRHFSSGGGFSNFYPTPGYQKAAVDEYFKTSDPGYPYYYANAAGTNYGANGGVYARGGRGIPDVAAFGAWVPAPDGGVFYHNFGTSLASPIFAAVVTLLNEERAAVGKGPVGFINPVMYENAGVLNDITKGRNPNCGTQGFLAAPGWDPNTGLGTPNYPKMLELFMSLP